MTKTRIPTTNMQRAWMLANMLGMTPDLVTYHDWKHISLLTTTRDNSVWQLLTDEEADKAWLDHLVDLYDDYCAIHAAEARDDDPLILWDSWKELQRSNLGRGVIACDGIERSIHHEDGHTYYVYLMHYSIIESYKRRALAELYRREGQKMAADDFIKIDAENNAYGNRDDDDEFFIMTHLEHEQALSKVVVDGVPLYILRRSLIPPR